MTAIHCVHRCAYCSRQAISLCDLPVRHIYRDDPEHPEPCHMPICEEHSVRDGDLDLCRNHYALLHPEAESKQEAMAS